MTIWEEAEEEAQSMAHCIDEEWGAEGHERPRGSAVMAALARGRELEEEFEKYRLRLAGVLTVLEGANEPRPDKEGLAEYVAYCPTFRAAWRLRDKLEAAERERDEARKELEQVENDHMNCAAAIVVLKRERDEYEIALVKISEWIKEEKAKHERRARGGQMAGDSHSPRVVPSVLIELERLIRIEDARFTCEAMFEMQAKVDRFERTLKTALKQLSLKNLTLPLNVTEVELAQDFSAALGLDGGKEKG